MLKHIKKTFLPVILCLVLCTCTACTSRSKEETETSETETEISKTETETSETICVRVLTPSLPGKNHCRSTTQLSMSTKTA